MEIKQLITNTERVLQVLECLAEDELYKDFETDIELLERIIRSEVEVPHQAAKEEIPRQSTLMTFKEAVRYSIFTIDEE
jgi:hypothetical protein